MVGINFKINNTASGVYHAIDKSSDVLGEELCVIAHCIEFFGIDTFNFDEFGMYF